MKNKSKRKIWFSTFAGTLAGTAIVVPNVSIKNNVQQDNDFVSSTTKNAAATTNTNVAPNANDLYNDFSYNQGFVSITNSVITFYDWLGLKVWSFDVNASSNYLFGFNTSVQTIKVRSSSDGLQMYVYGTLVGNKSYIFKLNVATGLSIPFSDNMVSFVSDGTSSGLITGANLITFTNGYMIVTPKNPELYDNEVYVSFSEINLATNALTTRTFNIAPAASGQNVYSWGEIESIQKIGSYYSIAVKYNAYNNGLYRPSLLVTCLDAQIGSDYAGTFITSKSFSFLDWQSTPFDLDNIAINVVKLTDTSTTQKFLFFMKYSTMNVESWPVVGCSNFGICEIDSSGSASISSYDAAQSSDYGIVVSDQAETKSVDLSNLSTGISGILGYFDDKSSGIVYMLVANSDLSKIGFLPISDTILYGDPMGGNIPWWINISGFSSARHQTIDFNFIPGNSGANNTYYGYIQADQQNSDGSVSTKKSIFSLNTAQGTFTVQNMNFEFAYSDDQINQKYNNSSYAANLNTEQAIVNDLTKVLQNGNQYFAVNVVSDYLLVNTSNYTVRGSVVFAINNYWNSGQSQITRSVNILLNPLKNAAAIAATKGSTSDSSNSNSASLNDNLLNNTGSKSSSNVIIYSVIIVAALIGIAVSLVVVKILKNKRK